MSSSCPGSVTNHRFVMTSVLSVYFTEKEKEKQDSEESTVLKPKGELATYYQSDTTTTENSVEVP